MAEKKTPKETVHPTIVLNDMNRFITSLELDSNSKKTAFLLSPYLLTSVYREAFGNCITWLDLMNIETETIDRINIKYLRSQLSTGKCSNKRPVGDGTEYPVFYAIWMFFDEHIRTPEHSVTSLLCSIFLGECQNVFSHSGEITIPTYYHHVLSVRDTFLSMSDKLGIHHVDSAYECRECIIDHLQNQSKLSEKEQTCLAILVGDKEFGVPEFEKESGDRSHEIKEEINDKDLGTSDGASIEIVEHDIIDDTMKKRRYREEPEYKTVSRTPPPEGSRLTRKDDRRQLLSRLHAIAARNVPAITDLHRPPLPVVVSYFSHLADENPLWLSYAWILDTTGIAPARLEGLTVRPIVKRCNSANIYFESSSGQLVYIVENGATIFDVSSERTTVRLLMPDWIIRVLSGNKQPFITIQAEMDADLRTYKHHHAGISPTPLRLAAGFFVLFSEQHFTSLEAAIITGTIPGRLKAQSKYYAFDLAELNQKFQKAHASFSRRLTSLSICSSGLKSIVNGMTFSREVPKGIVGSQLAVKPEEIHPLVERINHLFNKECSFLRTSLDDHKMKSVIRTLKLQHINLYLILQIYTCIRPIGEVSKLSYSTKRHRASVQDKASALHIEKRLTIFAELIVKQLKACHENHKRITDWIELNDLRKVDQFIIETSLPTTPSIDEKGHISMQRMSGSLFREALKEFNLESLYPKKNNAWRHINATALNGLVPEIVLDEMMGHDREGLDLAGPWSTASLACFDLLTKEIEHISNITGLKCLKIEEFV